MPRLGMFWAAALGVGVVTCAVVFVRQKSSTLSVNLTADGTRGKAFSRGPFRVVEDSVRPRDCSFAQEPPPKPFRVWLPVLGLPSNELSDSSQADAVAVSASDAEAGAAPGDSPDEKLESTWQVPVVVFQHGFASQNYFYSDLLSRIASHGYIVVAPQMYSILAGFDTLPEMRDAVKVINWLHTNLHALIHARIKPAALAAARAAERAVKKGTGDGADERAGEEAAVAQPDWSRFVLAGHSRGGKVTFGILRKLVGEVLRSTKQQHGLVEAKLPVPIKAAILFDPVDGTAFKATNPPTLTHQPDSISLVNNPPVLVIGSGLGPIPRGGKSPSDKGYPCAPENLGHKVFFSDLVGPAYHFSVPECGHADFYDDNLGPIYGPLFSKVCNNGPAREPMRVAAGGLAVAFLKAVVGGGGYGEKGGRVRGVRSERSGMEVETGDGGGVRGAARSLEEKRQALERLVTDAAGDVADVATAAVVESEKGQGMEQKQEAEQEEKQEEQQEEKQGQEQQEEKHGQEPQEEKQGQEQQELERERQRLEGVYLRSVGRGEACGVDSEGGIGCGSIIIRNREGGCAAVIGSGKGSDVSDLCDLLQHPDHSPVVLSEVGWKVGRGQELPAGTPEGAPEGTPAALSGAATPTVTAAAARL
ncbi:unnamed protein product [Closterium sp. Yama58-4]|nr:unnamed protein product [Closterium sp. Yama58-4]